MIKLKKGQIPSKHNLSDFKCFTPIAIKDGEFDGTNLCELGCFKQDGTDSNKFYVAAIIQSEVNKNWYTYFEWGRVGGKTDFQFYECSNKEEAHLEYCKQLHKKNDKRGEWYNHPKLGRILRAKSGKDCYLVRDNQSLSISLPDAKSLRRSSVNFSFDRESSKLLEDLKLGTISYTKSEIVSGSIPSKESIDQAREIIALSLVSSNQKEIEEYTNILYSKIPKIKKKGEDYLLSKNNAKRWSEDLDAFENALVVSDDKPNFNIEFLDKNSEIGKFIINWFSSATKNVHNYFGKLQIKNLWRVDIPNEFDKKLQIITRQGDKPLHQISRIDLDNDSKEKYNKSNTAFLFHGTRSVNVGGILNSGFRLPKELTGVSINGSLYGAGCYFADDYKKSANYCSLNSGLYSKGSGSIVNRSAFIFICDVILGQTYTPKYLECKLPNGYDSFYAKSGISGVQNNEFIIFDTNQVKIRYLVEFIL